MNNECGALYYDATGLKHTCNLVSNHEGSHYDYKYRRTWPSAHPYDWGVQDARYRAKVLGEWALDEGLPRYKARVLADLEPKTTVQLTLTDLKTIAYYMAEEEDADPTKAKIDKALKEML